jgi:hypothetical protein
MMLIYMDRSINTINKNTETLLGTVKEAGPEVNEEETKCMFMSYHQNAQQNQNNKGNY